MEMSLEVAVPFQTVTSVCMAYEKVKDTCRLVPELGNSTILDLTGGVIVFPHSQCGTISLLPPVDSLFPQRIKNTTFLFYKLPT